MPSKEFVFMNFFGTNCGPCQTMKPILDQVLPAYHDKIDVVSIDTDAFPHIAEALRVRSVPTFILFRNDEEEWRKGGLLTTKDLKALLDWSLH